MTFACAIYTSIREAVGHILIRSCCCQSIYAFSSRHDSTLLGHVFFRSKMFLHEISSLCKTHALLLVILQISPLEAGKSPVKNPRHNSWTIYINWYTPCNKTFTGVRIAWNNTTWTCIQENMHNLYWCSLVAIVLNYIIIT